MKLLHRMLAAPLMAVAFLVASGIVSHVALSRVTADFETLRDERLRTAHEIAELKLRLVQLNSKLYRTMSLSESLGAEKIAAARTDLEKETLEVAKAFEALASSVPAEAADPLRQLPAVIEKYRGRAVQGLTIAESSPSGGVLMLGGAEKVFTEAFSVVAKVNDIVDADVAAMSEGVLEVSNLASRSIVGMVLLAIVASLVTAIVTARRMVHRVDHAVDISESIARGELRPFEAGTAEDEIGRLLRSLANTSHRLSESVLAIQVASGSINTAAAEIAAGSMNLSERTELTATSLESTMSAMREMGGLVGQGNDSARQARELVDGATGLADSGGRVVADVVKTMREINEESKKISDITGVIDSIAFQTNILALNAAVEAARAGEEGRGFAVVASEVRALAQRSAAAAKEIKTLIVGSVGKVEQGAELVDRAGHTMHEIVAAVRRVDAMIGAVGDTSSRQSQGLTDVTGTLQQFDRMTQENAALAEQSAAASESLQQQASRLAEVTGQFKVVVA